MRSASRHRKIAIAQQNSCTAPLCKPVFVGHKRGACHATKRWGGRLCRQVDVSGMRGSMCQRGIGLTSPLQPYSTVTGRGTSECTYPRHVVHAAALLPSGTFIQ